MTQERSRTETKSAERLKFAHYLRTGRHLADSAFESNTLKTRFKFNQNHDPSNGEFTFGPGDSASLGRSGGSNIRTGASPTQAAGRGKPAHAETPLTQLVGTGTVRKRLVVAKPGHQPVYSLTDIGALSAKYESSGPANPGKISTGKGDTGGVSYGTYQLATNTGTLGEFLASPEARKYAPELQGLKPATPGFGAKWREIASREPEAFHHAQGAFVARTHYDRPVGRIKEETGFDVNRASDAVTHAVYSTNVQHGPGRGGGMIIKAIKLADQERNRSHSGYEAALINHIYDIRQSFFPATKERYARERKDALLGLAGGGQR